MTIRRQSVGLGAWGVLLAGVAVGGAAQGCSAPSVPGGDDLVVGNDTRSRRESSATEDAPEGELQGSTELGQGTKSTEPPPEPTRGAGAGDEGSNDAPAQCTMDVQCNQSGRICSGGACVKGCRDDAGCATTETCTAGQCAPMNASVECYADYDCDYGTICIGGACIDGCYTSYDCPTGQSCSAGKCNVTPTSSPPPAGSTPCTSDGQCNPGLDGSGQICSAQGTCVAGCHRDNQCPGTKICVSGMCR